MKIEFSGVRIRSYSGSCINPVRKPNEGYRGFEGDVMSEDSHPKGSAPPPQPSFNDLLEEERRNQWFMAYD